MTQNMIIAAFTAALFCTTNVMADDFTLLREERPRLELTADEIEALRADSREVRRAAEAADTVLERQYTQTYQAYYVSLPAAEFPPEHDEDWPYWTGIAGELRRYMEITARAHALTGERKYLVWCRQLMLAVADWRQWTDPWFGSQPGLDTHHLTRGMCVALDLLWDDLPEQDRARIIDAIAEKGAGFIHEYAGNPRSYLHEPDAWPNGFAMINTEAGVAGLTLLGEHDRAEEWLAQSLAKARIFFDRQGGIDGGLFEGLAYGSAAVDNLVYLATKAEAIVGESLFDHPYLSQAILFPAYFMLPGGGWLANFGDNGGPEGCPPTLLGLARALVEVEQCPIAAWYLEKVGEILPDGTAAVEPPHHLPTARHFRDIDWVAMRSGWDDTGSLLAFKSGHFEHRNHLDQNSFILGWNDEWLLTDPGHQVFDRPHPPERGMTEEMIRARHEYTHGTVGHNAILVDGQGQIARRGQITRFATTPAMDYAVGDASDCYASLRSYRRHIISVPPDYHVIFDEIATGGPARSIEVLLHTTPDGAFSVGGRPLPVGESREGQWASIQRTGEAVARFLRPARLTFEHRQWPHCEDYGHFLSASVGQVTDTTLAWVLAAGPASEVEIEGRAVEGNAGAVQVRVDDAVDTIAIASGDGGEADHVTFTGAAAMVRDSTQGVHRYALVDGTELKLGEATLVSSNTPVSAGATLEPDYLRARITCDEATSITLHCPFEPELVRLDGAEVAVDAQFDAETWTIALELSAGSHLLELCSG